MVIDIYHPPGKYGVVYADPPWEYSESGGGHRGTAGRRRRQVQKEAKGMDIAGLRTRILIEKNETTVDRVGNHRNAWKTYFRCWASAYQSGGSEEEEAGHTRDAGTMDFTVRYCPETAAVRAGNYRIIFGGWILNIVHVDFMAFKNNSIKFHCERVER